MQPSPSTVPPHDPTLIGPNQVVAVTLVAVILILAAVVLAWIAASLLKNVAVKALEKADTKDVPAVLSALTSWIRSFRDFLPTRLGGQMGTTPAPTINPSPNDGQLPESSASMQHDSGTTVEEKSAGA